MTELPQVRRADGRTEPFDPDRLCRSLFAATQAVGRADPFLARELTDAVVHFLIRDLIATPLLGSELAELTAKVLRELGHPALARAYAERPKSSRTTPPAVDPVANLVATAPSALELNRRVAALGLERFTLSQVYPPDLVAAHHDGLLTLTGLDAPLELAGYVARSLPLPGDGSLMTAVCSARDLTGGVLAIDSPEYVLAGLAGSPARLAAMYRDEIHAAARAVGLTVVVNLNVSIPPLWADPPTTGPLFAALAEPVAPDRLQETRIALLDALFVTVDFGFQGIWHLSGDPVGWKPAVEHVLAGARIEFAADGPRRPPPLGHGLTRDHPEALGVVGVHLPRLAAMIGAGPTNPRRLLDKLGSLARLVRGAGHARLDFLRKSARPDLRAGFRLNRARLVVVPVGLSQVVRELIGADLAESADALDFGRQITRHLADALTAGGRLPEAVLDVAGRFPCEGTGFGSPREQLRAAEVLHLANGGAGLSKISLSEEFWNLDSVIEVLKIMPTVGDVARIRFVPASTGSENANI